MYKLTINKIDYTDKLDIKSVEFSNAINEYDFTFTLYLQTKEGLERLEALQLAEVEFYKNDSLLVGGILWDIKPKILQRQQMDLVRTQYLVECTINSYKYLTSKILTKGGPADISTPDFTDTSSKYYFRLEMPPYPHTLTLNSKPLTTSGLRTNELNQIINWDFNTRVPEEMRLVVYDDQRNMLENSGKFIAEESGSYPLELEKGLYILQLKCYDSNNYYSVYEYPFSVDKDSDYSYFVPYSNADFEEQDNVSDTDITITKPSNKATFNPEDITEFQVKWTITKGITQNAYRIDVYDSETNSSVYTTGKVKNSNKSTKIPITNLQTDKIYYFTVMIYFEEETDLNNAEKLFYRYAQTYLKPKNIFVSKRNIETNLTIGEIADDELEPKPYLSDVFDYLADKTKSSWNITANKAFTVKTGRTEIDTYEFRFDEMTGYNDQQKGFFDLEISKSGEDIVNRITVKGSSEHESTDEQYIDEEGRLTITIDNKESQEKLRKAGLGDGVMEYIEENDKITTVEELKRYAEEYVAKYGDGMKKLSFSTYSEIEFKPGDFIGLTADSIGFYNELCMVDKITYNFASLIDETKSMRKDIECTIRKDNNPLDNWVNMFKPKEDGNKTTEKTPSSSNNQSGLLSESLDIQMMEDVITTVFLEIDGEQVL